ncbi:MAG: hypothetical protein ACO1SX_00760 [Actinomycetota bacterium]
MRLDSATASFGEWLAGEYQSNPSYDPVRLRSGDEAAPASLIVRLGVGRNAYYLARVNADADSVEVGLATEGRMLNEALEQMILDNGGDLDDLLADELCDLGEEPLSMRHFFERPAFYFVVPLPLQSPAELDDPAFRNRVKVILTACENLFQGCIDEA